MTGADSSGGCSSSDHATGAWYSVPDLRLRDHYFTVPLDYSLDSSTCPKITIFAREVVSGTVIGYEIMLSSPSCLSIAFDLILFLLLCNSWIYSFSRSILVSHCDVHSIFVWWGFILLWWEETATSQILMSLQVCETCMENDFSRLLRWHVNHVI